MDVEMKKYTLEDLENFEIDEYSGYKICPTGDYTGIRRFPGCCIFGRQCSFGEWSSFGEQCSFGERCSFGRQCSFGEECSFGRWISFGELCIFGRQCSFDKQCRFGRLCSFGERCRFSELWLCSFGEQCSFGGGCKVENNKEIKEMIKFEGFGSKHRCTYFFKLTDGRIYVRCGCFAGYIDEFREQVKETHGDNKFAKEYEAVADLAEMHFGD